MGESKYLEGENMFPEKIHHVVLYVLSYIGRDLGTTEIDNIIYLIDVAHAAQTSRTLTGSKYIRKKWGSYGLLIRDAIKEMKWYEIKIKTEVTEKRKYEKSVHTLNDYARFEPQLDAKEIEYIQGVLDEIKDLSPVELNKRCFHTTPMEAIRKKETEGRLIDEELVLI